MAWHREYRPIRVGYEKYGMQSDIEHIEFVQALENYRFNIVPLAGPEAKNDRIRKLIPIYKAGRMYLPQSCVKTNYEGKRENLVQIFINDEYKAFPVPFHDDMLDGQARILDPDMQVREPKPKSIRQHDTRADDYDVFAA